MAAITDYQHEKTLSDHRAWLGTPVPEGLVVSPAVLADAQVVLGTLGPERQRLFTSLTTRRGDLGTGSLSEGKGPYPLPPMNRPRAPTPPP